MKMHRPVLYFAVLLGISLFVSGCANAPKTESVAEVQATLTVAEPTISPSQTSLPLRTDSPTLSNGMIETQETPPTPTRTPMIDADGNVTWHPQKELISWSESGADGSSFQAQNFALFWDGTLLQRNNQQTLYITKLNQDEICKILNTVKVSGFFEETESYNFPFAGGASSGIAVHGWKSNQSGAQLLWGAVTGEPYYDTLFCRNCPIPSEETIIRPGLANVYYLLQNYLPAQRQLYKPSKILVHIYPSEKTEILVWPLTSLTLDQFIEKCAYCDNMGTGAVFDGEAAQEIMMKIPNGTVIKRAFYGNDYPSIEITYEAVWPEAQNVPDDATLTCNTKVSGYPILPLSHQNKFWYYAPDGKWGAERVEGQNKMRVVNTSGYEKFYSYDATFFGQSSIQFYPRYWSEDDQFFYVNVLPGDYKPDTAPFNSIGLEQIDVKNEKIKYIFLSAHGENFAYEFSHDGKRIAYIRQNEQPLKLVVINTYSYEEHAVSLTKADGTPYTLTGALTWSKEGDKILIPTFCDADGVQRTCTLSTNVNNLSDIRIID